MADNETTEAFRYWVTLTDDEGRQLVIQHNTATGEMEVAWLTEGGELINGFWTMDATKFVDDLHLRAAAR